MRRAQLESVSAAAEAQARGTDRGELTAARAETARSAPRPRPVGQPRVHKIPPRPVTPPATPAQATGVPDRLRSALETVPVQVVAGFALVVLGIVVAVLFLTRLLG